MSKIIGIDLGTTNSCVAVMEGNDPVVIVNAEGDRTTPSVICVSENETHVGSTARRQSVVKPKETIYSVKRMIGSKYDEVKSIAQKMPYVVKKSASGDVEVHAAGKTFSPPEISAKILQKLKRQAEDYLGEKVTGAVVTVPAYFNDSQRQATKDAGKIAGLEVKRIINEPTAAALAYGLDKKNNEFLAVYDFGGGTFDVSILEVGDGVVEVLSTNGDTRLGGDNVDEVVIDHLVEEFKKESGIDISKDSMAMQRLKEAAENTKKELSSKTSSDISLPFLTADSSGPKHLNLTLTRAKFDQLIDGIIKRTFKSCRKALKDAGKKVAEINQVVLVGGSTRIPLVVSEVTKFFKREVNRSVNPDEVVALGAAVQGGVLSGDVNGMLLLDVTPLSLGIETMGGVTTVLISRNTTIPTKKSEVFSTAANNQPEVDIHVLQGEREFASDNRTLGNFKLDGIPPAPRGVPQIEVTFDIDADGILDVFAKDKATGKEQKIKITSSSGLSDSDIDRMVDEAAENEEADSRRRKIVEARNGLDSLVYQAEKLLLENGDNLSDEVKEPISSSIESVKSLSSDVTLEDLIEASDSLSAAMQEAGKEMYANAQQEQDPVSPEDVIDAEVVE